MDFGWGPCWHQLEQWRSPGWNWCAIRSRHWQWNSTEVIVKRFKKYCVSDEIDWRGDEEGIGNVGSEHESLRQKMGIVNTLIWNRSGEQSDRWFWIKSSDLKKETNSVSFLIYIFFHICSMIMKLLFLCCILHSEGCLAFRLIIHLVKCGSTLNTFSIFVLILMMFSIFPSWTEKAVLAHVY